MKIRFGECILDSESRQLFRQGKPVHLPPKAFELLKVLAESRPRAMSKSDLLERVWPATFVSDESVTSLVTQIRAAIGDDARDGKFVRTVRGFGYAFTNAAADTGPTDSAAGRGEIKYWLIGAGRDFVVLEGTNIIGRDPECRVQLDSPRVSRHHAQILIAGGNATIEDLGSKNGTFLRGERIAAPARIDHGDQVRVGSFVMTFRAVSAMTPTVTEE